MSKVSVRASVTFTALDCRYSKTSLQQMSLFLYWLWTVKLCLHATTGCQTRLSLTTGLKTGCIKRLQRFTGHTNLSLAAQS